ncbi:hypothetical protein ACKAV7_011954 [Fusarium commune]
MSAKHAERTISYASPEDWDSWSNEFKKLAHAYDLWQQADPDDPDSGTMTPGSDYVPPRRIGELTSEGRAEYEHDIRIYSLKETAYRETKKQEQKLVEFVLKTVSATYQKTSCVTGDRLDKWYQELRRSGVVYNERLRPEARDKYHKAVHTAPKINKLNEWVTEWETTMAEAITGHLLSDNTDALKSSIIPLTIERSLPTFDTKPKWPTLAEGRQESREAHSQPYMALHPGTTDLQSQTAIMTLLKSKEMPLIGRWMKHPMHIEIREAKAVGVEHEAAEEEFLNYRPAPSGDFVYAGESPVAIHGKDDSILCTLTDHFDQYVLEYIDKSIIAAAFLAKWKQYDSWTKRPPRSGDETFWHLRLGHPGPEALKHLVGQSRGVKIRGISTVECDACGMAKVKRQVRRQRRVPPEKAGIRLAIDFYDISGDPGYTSAMLVTDRYSGYIWDYYLPDRTAPTLIGALEHLLRTLERQLQCRPEVIECNNEIPDSHQVSDFLSIKNGMRLEPSAPYAQSQNGSAERSGGVIKEKARAMRIGAKLPSFLWVKIWRAAVYLYNRTPKYIYNWKTPYERFYTYFAFRDGVVVTERKPD